MSVSRISATSCDWVIADFLPHPVLEWSQNASGPFTFASSPSTIQVHWNDVWYFKQSGRHLWPTNSKRRWQIHLGSWSKQSRPQELLTLENPKCAEIVAQFSQLKGVTTKNNDEKAMLTVHLILGANEYAKIKNRGKTKSWVLGRTSSRIYEVRLDDFVIWNGVGSQQHFLNVDLRNRLQIIVQVRRLGAKGQSKWRTGNRSRRVQRETNQEFKRLVRDEPALERESSSPTEQSHRKFKTSQKSCAEVRDARRAGEVQRHYPDSTESRDHRTHWWGSQGRKRILQFS